MKMADGDLSVRRFYGRRHGRRLRAGRERLVRELLPHLTIAPPDELFDPFTVFDAPPQACWLEVGFGAGEHIAAQAQANPNVGFIGCEPYINGIARLLTAIDEEQIDNIRIFPDDARLLLDWISAASLERVFVLFPDPWPKNRHAYRRFVCPENLDLLSRIMADGAELRIASDEMGYIRWTLFHVRSHPDFEWMAAEAQDWRKRPADWPPTRYEEKALAAGKHCAYLGFRRRPRSPTAGKT